MKLKALEQRIKCHVDATRRVREEKGTGRPGQDRPGKTGNEKSQQDFNHGSEKASGVYCHGAKLCERD